MRWLPGDVGAQGPRIVALAAVTSSLLTGCNALFGLSEAELRDGEGSTSATGSGTGGDAATSSSSGGGAGGGEVTSSSTGGGGGGEEYVGCAGDAGSGGAGRTCTIVHESRFRDGSLAGWQTTGTVLSQDEGGERYFRLDASGGAYVTLRRAGLDVLAGDEVCLAARTRVSPGAMMAQPHLDAWIAGTDPLAYAAELSVDYGATSFSARETSALVDADATIYLELSVQGDTEPDTVHLDADDITLVVRRCN